MAVYDSDKKRILTRILKVMILLFVFFLAYILLSSTQSPIKDIKTVFIPYQQLAGVNADVILVKGVPIAVSKQNKQWYFYSAVVKQSGCVVRLLRNNWFDVCTKQHYLLNGQAQGDYPNLQKITAQQKTNGFVLSLENN